MSAATRTKVIERRIVEANASIRSNADGTVGARGYGAVFNSPAHGEVVTRAAFNRTLEQGDNIRFLINHEGTPLASTRSGTMTVGIDDHGLWWDIPSLDLSNPRAAEFVSATRRGDMHQCSFAGYFRDSPNVDGVRELREVQLIDVSGVTFPWYEDTSMGLTGNRSADKALLVRALPEIRSALMADLLRAAPPNKESYGDLAVELLDQIMEQVVGQGACIYIEDFGSDWVVYSMWDGVDWDCYQVDYTMADGVFTFGVPFEVEAVTEYRPAAPEAEPAAEEVLPAAGDAVTASGGRMTYSVAEARALLGS
jgi:HK97 family phage prohead protease